MPGAGISNRNAQEEQGHLPGRAGCRRALCFVYTGPEISAGSMVNKKKVFQAVPAASYSWQMYRASKIETGARKMSSTMMPSTGMSQKMDRTRAMIHCTTARTTMAMM